MDKAIHGLAKVICKICPPTWKAVKGQITGDEKVRGQFIVSLKEELRENGLIQ